MRRATLLFVAVMLGAGSARATVLLDWTLEERIARADAVVIGTVASSSPVRDGQLIFTESTITVERALYGKPGRSIVVRQIGGTIGSDTVDVAGVTHFTVGERVVVIVKGQKLVGMSAGAFTLDGEQARQRIEVPLARHDGQLLAPPGERFTSLEIIRAAIARVRATR